MKLRLSKGKGPTQSHISLPETEPGLEPGSTVLLPLPDSPPLYLDPGLWVKLTPRERHAVLFWLRRGGAVQPRPRLTGPTQSGYISSPRKSGEGLQPLRSGKAVLCRNELLGSPIPNFMQAPSTFQPWQQGVQGCLGTLHLPGQLLGLLEAGGPGVGYSGGVLRRFSYCPSMATELRDDHKNHYSNLLCPSLHKYFLTQDPSQPKRS